MATTGYTYPVAEGKITEFADFAMSCARAFGACISMRDDPMDASIPNEFKPDDYYEQKLNKARERLAELRSMTPEAADMAAAEAYEAAMAGHVDYEQKCEAEEARLTAMLAQVKKWAPPTAEHQGLKSFMIDHLMMSKRGTYRSPLPVSKTGAEWLRDEIERATENVGRYAAEHAKEVERAASRTQWMRDLRESLSPQPAAA